MTITMLLYNTLQAARLQQAAGQRRGHPRNLGLCLPLMTRRPRTAEPNGPARTGGSPPSSSSALSLGPVLRAGPVHPDRRRPAAGLHALAGRRLAAAAGCPGRCRRRSSSCSCCPARRRGRLRRHARPCPGSSRRSRPPRSDRSRRSTRGFRDRIERVLLGRRRSTSCRRRPTTPTSIKYIRTSLDPKNPQFIDNTLLGVGTVGDWLFQIDADPVHALLLPARGPALDEPARRCDQPDGRRPRRGGDGAGRTSPSRCARTWSGGRSSTW